MDTVTVGKRIRVYPNKKPWTYRTHITSYLPPRFDPHQFAYSANRSTEDATSSALHSALSHLEQQWGYAWLLFVDFSSAFNTILPNRLVTKLSDLGIPYSICCCYLTPEGESRPPHLLSTQSQHRLPPVLSAELPTLHHLHK